MRSKIKITVLLLVLIISNNSFAEKLSRVLGGGIVAEASYAAGARIDSLEFDTRVSNLKWYDLYIFDNYFNVDIYTRNYGFNIKGNYGFILLGSNRDSDYYFDFNKYIEWSRSDNKSNGDKVFDVSASIYGILADPSREGSVVKAKAGAALSSQYLKMTNGNQTISVAVNGVTPMPKGSFSGLNSSYNATWQSFFGGAEVKVGTVIGDIYLDGEYHFYSEYRAEGNWNLREDFAHPVSFVDTAYASGIKIKAGYEKRLVKDIKIFGNINYINFTGKDGVETTYFTDGTKSVMPLKYVMWNSSSINAGAEINF